jgi:microsomal dipeptidase-like Zn-dependent dipeptidase
MSVVGYADLHSHPMAHLAFGGMRGERAYFWGEPTGSLAQALRDCSSAHSFLHGGGLLPQFTPHEKPGFDGYDTFASWPKHTSLLHQQMHVAGIQRAFLGGLRLMVASAVNSELLADMYHGPGIDSSDETAIAAQLQGMRAMADACSAWMQIVTTPGEARAVMEAGKLAVVLAIEVDSIAGEAMRRDGQLDPAAASGLVQKWWNAGVRMLNPVHLVDNALAGTAIYDDRFNLENHYLLRKWSHHEPQPWFYAAEAVAGDLSDVRFLLGGNPESALLINLYNQGYPTYIKQLGRTGHANKRSLSAAGVAFIEAMMDHGMLIDVEHLSSHALDRVLSLAQNRSYPLISSHTLLRALAVRRPDSSLYVPGCATEAMRSDRQLRALGKLGSVLGVAGHVGPIAGLSSDTSRNWARAYRHAHDTLGMPAVAIGTDTNGLAQAPGPRFRHDPSSPNQLRPLDPADSVRSIRYGEDLIPQVKRTLERSALGKRHFDYNTDGLAHYGLLPDFTVDVALSLGGEESLAAFFHSAEAFVEAWQRCVASSQ